jgi:hypothetical protein
MTLFKTLGCFKAHAFLSFGPSDQISDFPWRYDFNASAPVNGTSNTLAANWSALHIHNFNLLNTFHNAGVINSNFINFWTGTTATGVASNSDCLLWITRSSSFSGTYGDPQINVNFDGQGSQPQCDVAHAKALVCVCLI